MSFRRRQSTGGVGGEDGRRPVSALRGVRTSSLGYLQTSTGLAALDAAMGGGLTMGSFTLVIQDRPTAYYRSLPFGYFFAQGLAHNHATAIVTTLESAQATFHRLPSISAFPTPGLAPPESHQPAPRIAWRYSARPKNVPAPVLAPFADQNAPGDHKEPYCHTFDLSVPHNAPPDPKAPVSLLGLPQSLDAEAILADLTAHAEKARASGLPCRIGVLDADVLRTAGVPGGLVGLARGLKVLSREYNAAVLLGLRQPVWGVGRLADACLRLESFGGKGTACAGLIDGHALVTVDRLPGDGRMKCPPRTAWVVKRGRRKWSMEYAAGGVHEGDEGEGVSFEKGVAPSGKSIEF